MNEPAMAGAAPGAHAQAFVEGLVKRNVFYLLSAFLMLLGCYLINIPCLVSLEREIGGLLVLLGTINLYEGLVVAACGYIFRHAPRSRESSTLLVVELLFLLDVTFTINACLPVNYAIGIAIGCLSFALAVLKLQVLEAGAHWPLFGRLKRFLLPALFFLYFFQTLLVPFPEGARAWRLTEACLAWGAWTAFGALALALPFAGLRHVRPWRGRRRPRPWWQREAFKRSAAILALVLIGLQLAGQSWVYRAPFAASFGVPAAIGAMIAAPWLVRIDDRAAWRGMSAGIAAFLILVAHALSRGPHVTASFMGDAWTVTPLRTNLLFAALAFGLLGLRERVIWLYDAAGAFLAAAAMGGTLGEMRSFAAMPSLTGAAAFLVAGGAWLALRRGVLRAALFLAVGGWVVLRALAAEGHVAHAPQEWLRWVPLGWLALSVGMRSVPPGLRAALAVWCWCVGVRGCDAFDSGGLLYFYAVAVWWTWEALRDRRRGLAVLGAYALAGNVSCFGLPAGGSTLPWGWLAIGLAFAFFGVAFRITRQQVDRAGR